MGRGSRRPIEPGLEHLRPSRSAPSSRQWLRGSRQRAGREPIRGFATQEEENAFGRLVGERRARAALANELVETVVRLIGKRKSNNSNRARRVWPTLWRLGIQIEDGSRLKPVAVRLHVLTEGEPTEEAVAWFADWEDVARAAAEAAGITLLTTRHHGATCMEARLADRLIPLSL